MNRHTPGPWRLGKWNTIVCGHPVGDKPSDPKKREFHGGEVICESVTSCNAFLIMSAPLLFESLQECTKIMKQVYKKHKIELHAGIAKAEKALAQAQGKEVHE